MSSPIIVDDNDSFFESNKKVEKPDLKSIVRSSVSVSEGNKNDGFIKKDVLEETETELKEDIPSNYLTVDLVSNGRIEGIPKRLHFRCYSATDALDLNVDDEDRGKAVAKVLTRLNYEKFDVSLLPVEDIVYILYVMHNNFISPSITKKVYIDDTIEDEQELNSEKNLEEVTIPIDTLSFNFLGKNDKDEDIEPKIKVPFTIKDSVTKESVSFKLSVLKDVLMAESYCRNYYRDELIKFGSIRSALNRINSLKDEHQKDALLDDYLVKNEDKVNEYYEFMNDFSKMVVELTQAETIVKYNDKELNTLDEKWEVYNKLSYDIWMKYNNIIQDYPFGIKNEANVFIPSLQKTVHRRVGFQLTDFIQVDRRENTDRYSVEFD